MRSVPETLPSETDLPETSNPESDPWERACTAHVPVEGDVEMPVEGEGNVLVEVEMPVEGNIRVEVEILARS